MIVYSNKNCNFALKQKKKRIILKLKLIYQKKVLQSLLKLFSNIETNPLVSIFEKFFNKLVKQFRRQIKNP